MNQTTPQRYQCVVCGLWYADERTAQACEAWCKRHASCNLAITAHAVEGLLEGNESRGASSTAVEGSDQRGT